MRNQLLVIRKLRTERFNSRPQPAQPLSLVLVYFSETRKWRNSFPDIKSSNLAVICDVLHQSINSPNPISRMLFSTVCCFYQTLKPVHFLFLFNAGISKYFGCFLVTSTNTIKSREPVWVNWVLEHPACPSVNIRYTYNIYTHEHT